MPRRIDASKLASKSDLVRIIAEVDKVGVDKLKIVSISVN